MTNRPPSFRRILLRNEYRALQGRNRRNVLYLFIILFIVFFAFGFAKSTLNYQERLAGDPYSNWINLDYHAGTRDSLRVLKEMIVQGRIGDRYHIRNAFFCNKGMITVEPDPYDGIPALFEARSIDPASGILKELLSGDRILRYFPVSAENPFDYEPNGVIISRKLMEKQGMDPRTTVFLPVRFPSGDRVPLPVVAVADELPDKADIVYTNLFYCKSMNAGFCDRESNWYRIYAVDFDTAGILGVLSQLYAALRINDPATVETTIIPTGNPSVVTWKIEVGEQENGMTFDEMDRRVASLPALRGHPAGRWYHLSADTACDNSAFFHDYLAIEFRDLQRIRAFAGFLRDRLGLQLSLETLTDRENYLYTGNIALGALVLLMVLSTLFVAVHIAGTLRNHLLAVKKNLGNFLAFGVKNATLSTLYILVTLRILATAMIPAALLAWAAGELFERYLLVRLLVLDPAQDYFSLTNGWFALLLALIPAVAILRTRISVGRILKQTPGNLIYERDR